MSKHTPGPWVTNGTAVNASRIRITQQWLGVLSKEELDANANLIAAAPDLLEALKAVYATWLPEGNVGSGLGLQVVNAIAKAEGR